ncbi:unnamed protein product [Nippostrongylus brasiliensis]|uniref:BZIP domain-containing protein n=1 Tax=Nippostrongylus brasiliensis TaxID=27835 RepID=A0A158QYW7_NIPBR|nr:unnamed protein product [Nippostrongylus brasiliensis]
MSELLSALECDNVTFCDPLLTTAIDSEWGVWGSDENALASPTVSGFYWNPRDVIVVANDLLINSGTLSIKKEIVFLSGPKPPPPPLPPANSLTTTSCDLIPRTSPPLSNYATEYHQLSSPFSYDYMQDYSSTTELYPYYSPDFAKLQGSPESFSDISNGSISSPHLDYSHLISSHNVVDFGDDVSYGNTESSCGQHSVVQEQADPTFSFIDEIHESVRAELEAEKLVSSPAQAGPGTPPTPVLTIGVNSPVTIVGEDGKEYKLVVQELKRETKVGQKRKSSQLSEEERLEGRNSFLRAEAVRLQAEIDELRKALLNGVAKR